jgi:hypothetical protein
MVEFASTSKETFEYIIYELFTEPLSPLWKRKPFFSLNPQRTTGHAKGIVHVFQERSMWTHAHIPSWGHHASPSDSICRLRCDLHRLHCAPTVHGSREQTISLVLWPLQWCVQSYLRTLCPRSNCPRANYEYCLMIRSTAWSGMLRYFFLNNKGLFGFIWLKFNSHHINVPSNAWSTKCRLIAYMSVQIMRNLRDESIKPN